MRVDPGCGNHRKCEAKSRVFVEEGEKEHRVKLCFETIEATSYCPEAQHMKEMEISNKDLLKTCFVSGGPTWCFTFMSRLIFIATCVG